MFLAFALNNLSQSAVLLKLDAFLPTSYNVCDHILLADHRVIIHCPSQIRPVINHDVA